MKARSLPALLVLLSVSGAALADDAAILQCRILGDSQAAAAAAARTEQRFGLEQAKRKEAEPQSIQSTIEGDFDGWDPGAQIRLANGQVWRVVDGSSAVLSPMKNPQVKVTCNMLGTMFLEIEGTNNSPKVRRVR
ncbi:hypothetical protein ACI48D_17205 [Massilia sp. LXY-6]|uniref:hypothetical protein n=1 Tax=Massilia sp. LXY-6 TaxID=3379823 RepID=UPI003EE068C8